MSMRNSSYSVAPGPCVVAQLPSEDLGRLTDAQSREHSFLSTKMKVSKPQAARRTRHAQRGMRHALLAQGDPPA